PRRARALRTRSPTAVRKAVSSGGVVSRRSLTICIIVQFPLEGQQNMLYSSKHSSQEVFMQISILVGTMTGTAELVAGDVKKALEGKGHAVEILLMDNLKADVFDRPGAFLICTSTYGQGDVP